MKVKSTRKQGRRVVAEEHQHQEKKVDIEERV